MIKPTVGRVVLVFRERAGDESHQGLDIEQPEPALVTYVFDDHTVNVAGFTAAGDPFSLAKVHLDQEEDDEQPHRPFVAWMPYQVAAAKKFPVDLSKDSQPLTLTGGLTPAPSASQAPPPGAVQQTTGQASV